MLKVIKTLLERSAYFISTFLTLAILYLSLSSLSDLNVEISVSDKYLHSIAYFVLSVSWFFAVKKSHGSFKNKMAIAISVFAFGCILEILQQQLTSYRMMDTLDMLANSFGIILALATFEYLFKVYKMI